MDVMPSPYAFLVNGKVFFDPHPGRQVEVLQVLRDRVTRNGPVVWRPAEQRPHDSPAGEYSAVNVFLHGNRGSGKSREVRSFLHACAMYLGIGFRYVVVRRNMPDLRKNHLIYVGPEMRTLGGEFNETYGLAKYENGAIGFYCQCEDEKDAEKIVGAEAAVIFVDEAPQIKWDLLRLIAPSLRVAQA